ncbi:glycosyltransferase family 4 protein [Alcanivorax sp.]|uniref:glycosyltransferase family 4 protein n=1 Tax=Alcanivorax sp. TaxID=1872427 RepID=UPI0025C46868|nr:glycosyltransferase family 4 protein [Alcanivorax sp.]
MKLMHFIAAPAAGGAEVYVKDLCKAMAGQGHDVHLVFLSRAEEIGRDPDYQERYLSEIDSAGITYSFMPPGSRRRPFNSGRHLRNIVSDYSPDLLHCHLYYSLLFAFFVTSIPVVYTHHNILLKVPSFLYRIFDYRVAAYIGISQACANLLRSVSAKSVHRIDNGVDFDRILPVVGRRDSVPHVAMVGTLCEQKNYDLFLEAVSLLADLDFSVSIAGEGEDQSRLLKKADDLGLSRKVTFLGNISNVKELLAGADIFAMSSSWEGLPISLLEATAAGLPSIVTNVGGCSEVIHSCQSGVVVDDPTPLEYAHALGSLIESHASRCFYGDNASRYSSKYSIQYSAERHLALYDQLVRS